MNNIIELNKEMIANGMSVKEVTRRLVSALQETEALIAKEEPRDASIRPGYMQKALDHAIAHRAKLIEAIAAL